MKKRIAIILGLVAIIATLPYVFGLYTRYQVVRFLEQAQWPQGVRMTLERYDLRYTRSWAVVAVRVADPTASTQGQTQRIYRGYLRMKMYHGPLFPTDAGIRAGMGNIKVYARASDLVPNQVGLQDSLENFFEANEILDANVHIGFTGKLHTRFRISPAFYTADDEGLFQWGGLTGDWQLSSDFQQASLRLNVDALLLQAKEEAVLDMAAMKFTWTGQREADGPWVGTQTWVAPAFFLRDEHGNVIRVQHLDVQSTSAIVDNNVELNLRAEAEAFDFLKENFQRAVFETRMYHLDKDAFMTVCKGLTLHDPAQASRQNSEEIAKAVLHLLTSGAGFELQYAMDRASGGHINLQAKALFPVFDKSKESDPAAMTTGQWLNRVNASFDLSAPLDWVKDTFYRIALLQLPIDTPEYTDPEVGQIAIQDVLRSDIENQFKELIQSGIVILKPAADMHFNLAYSDGEILLNGRALTENDLEKMIVFLAGQAPQ